MIECRTREDRLYVLATVCKQKAVTPNSNTYMTIIQTVCCGKFLLSKIKARELASTLTSAYKHDHWAEILGENEPNTETHIDTSQTTFQQPYKTKRSLKQQAQILSHIAKKDTFNGVGRLHIAEIQLELGNLSADQIMGIWQAQYPEQTIVQNGNVLLIYWEGKASHREQRNQKATIQPDPISMMATKEYHVEPELMQDAEPANPDKLLVGEVSEDTAGCVEEEEDSEG